MRILHRPAVQLGLDLPYSLLRREQPQRAITGVHRRTFGHSSILPAALLAPFAMWTAFPPSDYYEASAPPDGRQLAMSLPTSGLAGRTGGQPQVVPTFTT